MTFLENKAKRKFLFIFFGIAAALIIALLFCVRFGFVTKWLNGTPGEFLPSLIITDSGTAYIPPVINGAVTQIEGEVFNAVLTPDRQRIAVLNQDGSLYVSDINQSFQTAVALNCNSLLAVTNKGILYRDRKNVCHRYLFSDGSDLSLGKVADYQLSTDSFHIAYADKKGNVYLLSEDSNESRKIGTYSKGVFIITLLNDGTCLYASNYPKEDMTLILAEGGNSTVLAQIAEPPTVVCNEEHTAMLIAPILEDIIYIKTSGQELQELRLPGFSTVSAFYTSDGIYAKNLNDGNLYWMNPDTCEYQVILLDVNQWSIANRTLYYSDSSGDFYSALMEGSNLTAQKEIDSDVSGVKCAPSREYVYYFKNYDEEKDEGDLYVYGPDSVPAKVDSMVSDEGFYFSTDEKTVYYYTEASSYQPTSQSGTRPAYLRTLRCYTFDTKETQTIARAVVPKTLTSGLASGAIDNSSYIFQKYWFEQWGEVPCYRWYYYDGSTYDIFAHTLDMANSNSFSIQ